MLNLDKPGKVQTNYQIPQTQITALPPSEQCFGAEALTTDLLNALGFGLFLMK